MHFIITVDGRPEPQGSKGYGAAGQMIESNHRALVAWRKRIKLSAFRELQRLGIDAAALPLFPRGQPVYVTDMTFIVADNQCRAEGTDEPVGQPDIDKFLRAALDALGGGRDARMTARILADDSQVVSFLRGPRKVRQLPGETPGAIIGLSSDRKWDR